MGVKEQRTIERFLEMRSEAKHNNLIVSDEVLVSLMVVQEMRYGAYSVSDFDYAHYEEITSKRMWDEIDVEEMREAIDMTTVELDAPTMEDQLAEMCPSME